MNGTDVIVLGGNLESQSQVGLVPTLISKISNCLLITLAGNELPNDKLGRIKIISRDNNVARSLFLEFKNKEFSEQYRILEGLLQNEKYGSRIVLNFLSILLLGDENDIAKAKILMEDLIKNGYFETFSELIAYILEKLFNDKNDKTDNIINIISMMCELIDSQRFRTLINTYKKTIKGIFEQELLSNGAKLPSKIYEKTKGIINLDDIAEQHKNKILLAVKQLLESESYLDNDRGISTLFQFQNIKINDRGNEYDNLKTIFTKKYSQVVYNLYVKAHHDSKVEFCILLQGFFEGLLDLESVNVGIQNNNQILETTAKQNELRVQRIQLRKFFEKLFNQLLPDIIDLYSEIYLIILYELKNQIRYENKEQRDTKRKQILEKATQQQLDRIKSYIGSQIQRYLELSRSRELNDEQRTEKIKLEKRFSFIIYFCRNNPYVQSIKYGKGEAYIIKILEQYCVGYNKKQRDLINKLFVIASNFIQENNLENQLGAFMTNLQNEFEEALITK